MYNNGRIWPRAEYQRERLSFVVYNDIEQLIQYVTKNCHRWYHF